MGRCEMEKRGFKCLGVYLVGGGERKNWHGVLERAEDRLGKRRRLLQQMSYRRRLLISLVAFLLWFSGLFWFTP